jgi:hypothetical protein
MKKHKPSKIEIIELNELKIPEDFLIMEIKDKKIFLEGQKSIFKLGNAYYSRDDMRTIYIFKGEITKEDLKAK